MSSNSSPTRTRGVGAGTNSGGDFAGGSGRWRGPARAFGTSCLQHHYLGGQAVETTLLEQLCKLNPPANAVEILLDLMPETNGECADQYSRLEYCEYVLKILLENGGSLDVVKLLIDDGGVDEVGDRYTRTKPSAYRALIDNKKKYGAEAFSEILRYLVLMDTDTFSALLQSSGQIPLGLLWKELQPNISLYTAMNDPDFEFLLKETCYRHLLVHSPGSIIGRMPILQAFLVCSPCFDEGVIAAMLGHFFSRDSDFLLEKNSAGDYPIHVIIDSLSSDQFLFTGNNSGRMHNFKSFILKNILRIAPQCARQVNDEERHPLHTAADSKNWVSERETLLGIISEAYPEALSICDKKTGLPAFALAAETNPGRVNIEFPM